MIALEVHVQQLFLPERLLALAAGKWLLPGVRALVHDHVALLWPQEKRAVDFTPDADAPNGCTQLSFDTHLSAAVVTLIALKTLLVLVGLLVLDERVPLVEHCIAVAALLSRLDE